MSRNLKTESLCFVLPSRYNGYKKLRQSYTHTLLLMFEC